MGACCKGLHVHLFKIVFTNNFNVTGGWRKLHNEELHSSYSSQNMLRMMKSRRMRWAGHVAQMGEKMSAYRILLRKPE
jgi:hypothetical protein